MSEIVQRIWRSGYRLPLFVYLALIPYLLWQEHRYFAGFATGLFVVFVFAWLGEQWPQRFKRWVEPDQEKGRTPSPTPGQV